MERDLALSKRDPREKRDVHALNDDGMVACNPRDREAAHRAEVEGIATTDRSKVTCEKCLRAAHASRGGERSQP